MPDDYGPTVYDVCRVSRLVDRPPLTVANQLILLLADIICACSPMWRDSWKINSAKQYEGDFGGRAVARRLESTSRPQKEPHYKGSLGTNHSQ